MLIGGPAHGRRVSLEVEAAAMIVAVGYRGMSGHAGYRRSPRLDPHFGALAYSFVASARLRPAKSWR